MPTQGEPISMIGPIALRWLGDATIARETVTAPLADPVFFDRAFSEAGAAASPNGLQLSPDALHRERDEAGALSGEAA